MTHEQKMAVARVWSVDRGRPVASNSERAFIIDSYGGAYSITRIPMSWLRYWLWKLAYWLGLT